MSVEDQLNRQIGINLQLRKQLEASRRDIVEYCAKFCEDHEIGLDRGKYVCEPVQPDRKYTHAGDGYAQALRGLIGK